MLTENQPEGQRKLADQALLRALLHRSGYSSADLRAQPGRDYAREVVMIGRLRDGMVMGNMEPAISGKVVFSEAAALLRWENEGGSQGGGDKAVVTEKRGA